MQVEAVSLRERKKLETRSALRTAAIRLAKRDGFANLTINEIAEEAGVSPRTFFNYFDSKEDVLSSPTDVMDTLIEEVSSRLAEEAPFEALRGALSARLQMIEGDPREMLEAQKVVMSEPRLLAGRVGFFAETERRLTEVISKRGMPSADAYSRIVVTTLLAACRVAMQMWAESGGSHSPVKLFEKLVEMIEAGLAEPAARRRGRVE